MWGVAVAVTLPIMKAIISIDRSLFSISARRTAAIITFAQIIDNLAAIARGAARRNMDWEAMVVDRLSPEAHHQKFDKNGKPVLLGGDGCRSFASCFDCLFEDCQWEGPHGNQMNGKSGGKKATSPEP